MAGGICRVHRLAQRWRRGRDTVPVLSEAPRGPHGGARNPRPARNGKFSEPGRSRHQWRHFPAPPAGASWPQWRLGADTWGDARALDAWERPRNIARTMISEFYQGTREFMGARASCAAAGRIQERRPSWAQPPPGALAQRALTRRPPRRSQRSRRGGTGGSRRLARLARAESSSPRAAPRRAGAEAAAHAGQRAPAVDERQPDRSRARPSRRGGPGAPRGASRVRAMGA